MAKRKVAIVSTVLLMAVAIGIIFAVRFGATPENPSVSEVRIGAMPGKPNVIVILSDDAGYADFSMHGSTLVSTPNIDSIARNGVRFTNGYVSASVCSPTRAGIMTGRYQQRFGHEFNLPRDFDPNAGLPVDEVTLPEAMKDLGYRTIAVGKWHLGGAPRFHPLRRGFDDFYGFLAGARSYWPIEYDRLSSLHRNHEPVAEAFEYLTDELGRRAAEYIDRHKSEPFFLYLAFNAPHLPMEAKAHSIESVKGLDDDRKRRILVAMMGSLDDAVGAVLQALRRNKLEENTLLFFVNDNGGYRENRTSNAPLRGFKGRPFEGGLRVPFSGQWPARWPKGMVYDEAVISLDLLPTSVAGAGGDLSAHPKPLDGVNLTPFVTGESSGPPHPVLYWRKGKNWAIRDGSWKLVRVQGGKPMLFDLDTDISESIDLADERPSRVKQLADVFGAWNDQMAKPLWKGWRKKKN